MEVNQCKGKTKYGKPCERAVNHSGKHGAGRGSTPKGSGSYLWMKTDIGARIACFIKAHKAPSGASYTVQGILEAAISEWLERNTTREQ